jgi:hypothetical protein
LLFFVTAAAVAVFRGYAACGRRAVSRVPNFATGANVNFEQVTAMLPVSIWGADSIHSPVSVPNPFAIVRSEQPAAN